MKDRIILASNNERKLHEMQVYFNTYGIDVVPMSEVGITEDIEETGSSYIENAKIKAQAVWDITKGIVIGDDAGLEIFYLNNEPGLFSARYLGEKTTYNNKCLSILRRMGDTPHRNARYVCGIAAIMPDGMPVTTQEMVYGDIIRPTKFKGRSTSYNDIFYISDAYAIAGKIPTETYVKFSHRGKALDNIIDTILLYTET